MGAREPRVEWTLEDGRRLVLHRSAFDRHPETPSFDEAFPTYDVSDDSAFDDCCSCTDGSSGCVECFEQPDCSE